MKIADDSRPELRKSNDENGTITLTRRELLRQAGIAGLMLTLPWSGKLIALPQPLPKPPLIPYRQSKEGQGIIGPYGEVRVFTVGDDLLPAYVAAADGLGVMDVTERTPFIRYGAGKSAIMLTTAGVHFGSDKPLKWGDDAVKKLIAALAKDRKLANSALLLRSALHTAYPVAHAQAKAKEIKATKGSKKLASSLSKGSSGYGSRVLNCTTRTVTETVTRTITETVDVIKSAEQQYQECYDREINRGLCKELLIGRGACAAGVCVLTTFVDMVVGFIEIVTTVAEEVTREVISCAIPRKGEWPNPWVLFDAPLRAAVPQPAAAFTAKDIKGGLKFLTEIGGFLGPFGTCLIGGEWSLAQLETPIDFGNGNIALPYGVKVCIDSKCAERLSGVGIATELATSWGAALGALAALSPAFAAAAGPLGVTATAAIAAAAAAVSPVIVAAAAIILGFMILALIYGTAISAQLFIHRTLTDNFADGTVCIEHPTFALALIKMATLTIVPAELVPPIVTG